MNRPVLRSAVTLAVTLLLLALGLYLRRDATGGEFFMPHAHCYLFNSDLMRLHGGSDFLIGASYVSISVTLVWLVCRARRNLPFHWIMLAFAMFIIACGATHFMELWTLTAEHPRYWLSGWVKVITAIASVTTAVVLPPLVPRILDLMEAARSQFAAIVTSSGDAIVTETLDGVVTSWNAGAERLFGWSADEMIGQPVIRTVPADRQGEEDGLLRRLRGGERIEHYETIRVGKEGRSIQVSVTISPVRDSRGVVVGASKIARDITQRKQTEAELRAARDAAESANRAKDEFLAASDNPVVAEILIRAERHGGPDVRADGEVGVQQAGALRERDLRRILVGLDFFDDLDEAAIALPHGADGHGDAHWRAIRAVHPRMVGDGEAQRERWTRLMQPGGLTEISRW